MICYHYTTKMMNCSSTITKLVTPLAFLLCSVISLAQEKEITTPQSEKKAESIIKQKGENHLSVGNILIHKTSKDISFPVKLAIKDEIIEYLLVTDFGKTHETLLVTEASAYHLNIALKLVGYKESKELFRVYDESGLPSSEFFVEKEEIKAAARFNLFLTWEEDGVEKESNINTLIQNRVTKKQAEIRPFVYSGSFLSGGHLLAHQTGNIIAIFTDPASLANFSNKGHEDDTLWYPFKKNLPPNDAILTLTIKKHIPKTK